MQILLILIVLLGGTTIAAERSVPGQALYQVKINVNERIADAIAVNAEADANWHARAAERRLEEAEKLAAKGALTAEAKTEIEAGFKLHADMVNESLAKLEAEGDTEASTEVSTEFAATLREHEAAIAALTVQGATELSTVQQMLQTEAVMQEGASQNIQSNTSTNINVDVSGTPIDGGLNVTGSSSVKGTTSGSAETFPACGPGNYGTTHGSFKCCNSGAPNYGDWYTNWTGTEAACAAATASGSGSLNVSVE